MAEAAALFSLSAAAVVEDVLREHGSRLNDRDLATRRADEAGAPLALLPSPHLTSAVISCLCCFGWLAHAVTACR